MKTKTTFYLITLLVGSIALFSTSAFSQTTTATPAASAAPVAVASPTGTAPDASTNQPASLPVMSTSAPSQNVVRNSLASLTPAERETLSKAHQQALQDPAVQSTRQIARMALHKAMLAIDPSIETIFANMDARGPKDAVAVSTEEKALGGHYDKWAGNIPPTSRVVLTPEDRTKLRKAHDQAMKDLSVIAARKTARVTLYNAMINIDPTIGPLLTKAGIKAPSSVEASVKNSSIGSEEKIVGSGNGQQWSKEVLEPAIKKENQAEAAAAASAASMTATSPVPAASMPSASTPSTNATPATTMPAATPIPPAAEGIGR